MPRESIFVADNSIFRHCYNDRYIHTTQKFDLAIGNFKQQRVQIYEVEGDNFVTQSHQSKNQICFVPED